MVVAGPNEKITFGRQLAHHDKAVRDKGVKLLVAWLEGRNCSELELQKLWKGLMYCMWMSDKRPVQQDLAVELSLIMNKVEEGCFLPWLTAFYQTFLEEFNKLDRHRVDKYLLFLRIFTAEIFQCMMKKSWDMEFVKGVVKVWENTIMAALLSGEIRASGATLHFIKLFWDELNYSVKQGTATFDAIVFEELTRLFFKVAQFGRVEAICVRTHEFFEGCVMGRQLIIRKLSAIAALRTTSGINRNRIYESIKVLERIQQQIPQGQLPREDEIDTTIAQPVEKIAEEGAPADKKKVKKVKKVSYKKMKQMEEDAKKVEDPEKRIQLKLKVLQQKMMNDDIVPVRFEQASDENVATENVVESQPEEVVVESEQPEEPKLTKKQRAKQRKAQKALEAMNEPSAQSEDQTMDEPSAQSQENTPAAAQEVAKEVICESPKAQKRKETDAPEPSASTSPFDLSTMSKKKRRKLAEKLLMKLAMEEAAEEQGAPEPKKKKKTKTEAPVGEQSQSVAPVELPKGVVMTPKSKNIAKVAPVKAQAEPAKKNRVCFNLSANKVIKFRNKQPVGSKVPLGAPQTMPKGVLKRRSA